VLPTALRAIHYVELHSGYTKVIEAPDLRPAELGPRHLTGSCRHELHQPHRTGRTLNRGLKERFLADDPCDEEGAQSFRPRLAHDDLPVWEGMNDSEKPQIPFALGLNELPPEHDSLERKSTLDKCLRESVLSILEGGEVPRKSLELIAEGAGRWNETMDA
jgi:hypothetical protein